ncbi:MAG: hypothetical protein COC19_01260 [SAR86 cluster bacterium]|uniref:Histidine kinase n=1 Tax=SAR86 cluster bacterium TaxID=2030880 RepID=A0A2A4MT36_9GAMM|nr:MAG: hypothetical protein COC19_01260 [SAR86 cluster bacterium]
MKKLLKTTLATAVISMAAVLPAQAEISGNVSLGSDYLFRGVSQTGGDFTIQGGFDFEAENGFYAGVWGSNVTFAASSELDLYVGFAGDLTDTVGFDIGIIQYEYPGAGQADLDFTEIYGSLSYGGLTGGVAISNNLGDYESVYTNISYGFEIGSDISVSLFGGITEYDKAFWGSEDSYTDYGIALGKSYGGVDFAITLTDTNLSNADCGGTDDCDATVSFSISKSL